VALAIWLASRSAPLTRWADPLAAAHDGHRLALAPVVLAATAALLAAPPARGLPPRPRAPGRGALLLAAGPPPRLPPRAPAAGGPGGGAARGVTPNERLFSTTTNSRRQYWRVALRDFAHHPVLGSGAGTFVREWYRHRTIRADVTDAHSLYLETLAELGLVG